MSWDELFDRAESHATTVEAISEALERRRGERDDG
jgi:hypothetical protein